MFCIAVKVAVFYQQIMKLTHNYDFYDFPMPVYVRKTIHIKNFGNLGYTDTHFTWQNRSKELHMFAILVLHSNFRL